ncbi:MAG: hypothetical protein U1E14_18325 [Geminicoccaceae bacterium]
MASRLSCLLVVLAGLFPGPAAAVQLPDVELFAIERDIGAARAHAASLRRLDGVGQPPDAAAELVGISDGGRVATLRALRQTGRRLERRLLPLTAACGQIGGEPQDVAAAIDGGLAGLGSLIEIVARSAGGAADRDLELERIDATLLWLDGATAALWLLLRREAASASGDELGTAHAFDHR